MIVYLILGLVYAAWLEWYVNSSKVEIPPFRFPDRVFHVMLWPISVIIFVNEYYKALRRHRDE